MLHISNDPEASQISDVNRASNKHAFMSEVLAPFRTLYHTQSARGYQARESIRTRVLESECGENTGVFVHFRLHTYDVRSPLGWMLSTNARKDLNDQLRGYESHPDRAGPSTNQKNLSLLIRTLKGGP